MRNSRTASRALSVIALSIVGVVLVAGISQGDSKPLTKQKAKKLFYTKAKADQRFLNVGEVEKLTAEEWHEVGAPGQPGVPTGPFCTGPGNTCWANFDSTHNSMAFYKDPFGVVHLKGIAVCKHDPGCATQTSVDIFDLPPGYRPAVREVHSTLSNDALFRINVESDGSVRLSSGVLLNSWVSLDGITFRAA